MRRKTTVIDLLRHGEVEGGACFRGHTDHRLTAKGWEQMWAAVGTDVRWDRIITSPLARCADFARALAGDRSIPVALDARLRELHFGAWEGRTATELLAGGEAEALTRFWRDPVNNPPPRGEPLPRLKARLVAAWDDLLARYPGERLLLVTHGGPMRALLCHVSGRPLDRLLEIEVGHAARYRLCVSVDAGRDPGAAVTVTP